MGGSSTRVEVFDSIGQLIFFLLLIVRSPLVSRCVEMRGAFSFWNDETSLQGYLAWGRLIPLAGLVSTALRNGRIRHRYWLIVGAFLDESIYLPIDSFVPLQQFSQQLVFVFLLFLIVVDVVFEELLFVEIQKQIKFV